MLFELLACPHKRHYKKKKEEFKDDSVDKLIIP